MRFFTRREPVKLVMQTPKAEPPAVSPPLVRELNALDACLSAWAEYDSASRNWAAIDQVLDERLAVARAMVPVNPGRAS